MDKMGKERKSILSKMGVFIFGKKIQNHFFGEMIDVGKYYECRKVFMPTGKVVEIGLEKKGQEPDEKQKKFFNWIEDNYDLVIQKISPIIEEEIREWISSYRIQNFREEFILEYLYIPKCEEETFDWQISFYADNELQHGCSLEMKGLEVKQILIE